MSTNTLVSFPLSRPFTLRLHEWVTTVDHKRLGLLYILYALIFLLIGGVEAAIMRLQLIRPHNDLVSPEVFNRMFTMHGTTMIFFVAMPLVFGFANYLVPLMIGARDMAFPRLNAFSFWMTAMGGLLLYFQLFGRERLVRSGKCARCGVVRVCSSDREDVLAGTQHGLLDAFVALLRHRQHWNRDQYHRDDFVYAVSGNDARQNAAAGVA